MYAPTPSFRCHLGKPASCFTCECWDPLHVSGGASTAVRVRWVHMIPRYNPQSPVSGCCADHAVEQGSSVRSVHLRLILHGGVRGCAFDAADPRGHCFPAPFCTGPAQIVDGGADEACCMS